MYITFQAKSSLGSDVGMDVVALWISGRRNHKSSMTPIYLPCWVSLNGGKCKAIGIDTDVHIY